ncbi:MAG: urease accessory protein UreF [Stappia sp.]|nr:urease accessory protein UreF [Stappia sp.]
MNASPDLRAASRPDALYLLLAWLSPSFPVGAYTYSHGLEWAVEEGTVTSANTLRDWLSGILGHGAGRSDAILLARAMDMARGGDETGVRALLDLSLALQPTSERRLETTAQGDAFITAIRAAWPPEHRREAPPAVSVFHGLCDGDRAVPRGGWTYPLALAVSAAAWEVGTRETVEGFLHALAANLVSAAIRAVPLGQSDGQRVMNALRPLVLTLADEAMAAPLDDIGGCSFLADIASMHHETQYTRLFRS